MRSAHARGLAVAIVVAIALSFARAGAADDEQREFRVIVRPDSSLTAIDRELLRNAYLRKATEWPDGETIHPVDLSTKFPVRERFDRDILKKTPSQVRSYWSQQIFSGKGVPPPEAASPSDVVEYVLATPGAVGYLPAGVDSGRAKIVEVR